uniref:Uncharacterized protein n=1 Tax=Anopheles atroparvus TaxID=41427 RepID=A0AAG5DB97_ANOAO
MVSREGKRKSFPCGELYFPCVPRSVFVFQTRPEERNSRCITTQPRKQSKDTLRHTKNTSHMVPRCLGVCLRDLMTIKQGQSGALNQSREGRIEFGSSWFTKGKEGDQGLFTICLLHCCTVYIFVVVLHAYKFFFFILNV